VRQKLARSRLKTAAFYFAIVAFNLIALELLLRVANFRDLRVYPEVVRLPYDHDPELGWYGIPNRVRSDGVRINSIGLRDIELEPASRPTMVFVGDSFVYGFHVKAEERFTDLLRRDLPDFRVVNAGVAGYGTDQELLLLKRLWPKLEPRVVVLIVCVANDHEDNTKNANHGRNFKPYLVKEGDEWKFKGIPVPRSQRWYHEQNWFAQHITVVRLALLAYMVARHRRIYVPDPTDQLIGMMQDYVQSHGGIFLVGLQQGDPDLEPFLIARKIPYVRLDDAPMIPGDDHWSPEGHALVAERIKGLLVAENVLTRAGARP
jgi:hypothetical protein